MMKTKLLTDVNGKFKRKRKRKRGREWKINQCETFYFCAGNDEMCTVCKSNKKENFSLHLIVLIIMLQRIRNAL